MSQQKTLVILTPAFPATEAETHWIPFMQSMVSALIRNPAQLNIIVLAFIYPSTRSSYHWHGATVHSFDGAHKRKFRRIALWWDIWEKLKEIKRDHHLIGIFSFWCGECAFVGKWFAQRHSL